MKIFALHAALLGNAFAQGMLPRDRFICVEWPGHPHGYDAPIYYWNSAHEAYIWHGADCSMFPTGAALNCNASRIMGTNGSDPKAYSEIQGTTELDKRKRMAFFKSCRITVNTIEKDGAAAWVFKQNGATQVSGGTCTEANVADCTGKFTGTISVTADTEACLSSQRGGRNYRGYFASIKEKLVDGINPVLSMDPMFKAMVDGGIHCDATDQLPKITGDEMSIYGVMSWDNSKAMTLFKQVMPKPECLIEFPEIAADNLEVGGDTNRTCIKNITLDRRLSVGGVAGGKSAIGLLQASTEVTSGAVLSASSRAGGLASWMFIAVSFAYVRSFAA